MFFDLVIKIKIFLCQQKNVRSVKFIHFYSVPVKKLWSTGVTYHCSLAPEVDSRIPRWKDIIPLGEMPSK